MAMALRPFRRPRNDTQFIATCLLSLSVLPLARGQESSAVARYASPFSSNAPAEGEVNLTDGSAKRPGPVLRSALPLEGLPTVPSWYHQASSTRPVADDDATAPSVLELDQPQPSSSPASHPKTGDAASNGPLPNAASRGQVLLAPAPPPVVQVAPQMASEAEPWWNRAAAARLMSSQGTVQVDLAGLMQAAAQNSSRVMAVAQTPWIRGQEYLAAQATLDPTIFMQTRYDDTSDPVGDVLTTGGPNRLFENRWGMDAGVRGLTRTGATYSVGQQLGHLNSNSQFISPNDQGSARLGAAVSQPLLRNARTDGNRSLILTTRLETDAARAEYLATMVDQLGRVGEAYWRLYFLRASLLQRREHLRRAQHVASTLSAREPLDSSRNQILRAQAAVASREAAILRISASIGNTENLLRTLINTPGISDQSGFEIIPVQMAHFEVPTFNVPHEVAAALHRRPELSRLYNQLAAAKVQHQLAQNQTKPELNLIVEGYVAGLQGRSDVPGAWTDQFSRGRPGYAGGLEFEVPYRNRAAQAQLRLQVYEMRRIENLIAEQRANIRAEVENAIRNLEAARSEVLIRRRALAAVSEELVYQRQRWDKLQGDPRVGQFQLDELLGTQDRLFQEEQALLQALTDLNSALTDVQVATGALVRFSH